MEEEPTIREEDGEAGKIAAKATDYGETVRVVKPVAKCLQLRTPCQLFRRYRRQVMCTDLQVPMHRMVSQRHL